VLIGTLAISRPALAAMETKLDENEGAAPKKGIASGMATIWPDMKQGISFIVHHAGLLFVILAFAAGMFVLGCFGPLIAVYVRDTLHQSTKVYSLVSAMIGVGMFLGVNMLNTVGKKIKNTTLVYSGLGGIGIALCMLAWLPYVWSAVVADLLIGLAVGCIVVPATTLMQQETPAALMGRVGSTMMSVVFGAQILGLILSGQIANRVGVERVFVYCAVLIVVLMLVGKLFMEPKPHPETPRMA